MRQKILLMTVFVLGFAAAKANNGNDPRGGRKEDVLGLVIQSTTKKPMKDVTVTAYNVAKKEKVVMTDDGGGFSFDDLQPGTYKFVFEKAGYRKITKEKVVIKTDEAYQLNIEMIESSDFDIMPSPVHFSGM